MFITTCVQEYLQSKVNDPIAIKLASISINREMVKKCIMIIPYNAGILTKIDEILKFFNKSDDSYIYINDPSIILSFNDILYLVKTIQYVIHYKYPRIKHFTKYLQQVAKICGAINIPVPWVLPSGLSILHSYKDANILRVNKYKGYKQSFVVKLYNIDKINISKNSIALMPNLIHSLDANSLLLLINSLYNLNSFSNNFTSVHDCFGTSIKDIVILKYTLTSLYIDIYNNGSFIDDFHNQFLKTLSNFSNCSIDDLPTHLVIDNPKNKSGVSKFMIPNIS